jgi:Fe-S cluster biosynthesis and repair protein YggX
MSSLQFKVSFCSLYLDYHVQQFALYPKEEVNKVFRDVSKEELSMYFRQWSTNHPRHLLMEEVRSTQTRRAVQDLCSVCVISMIILIVKSEFLRCLFATFHS